jgi:hypothetical protein
MFTNVDLSDICVLRIWYFISFLALQVRNYSNLSQLFCFN